MVVHTTESATFTDTLTYLAQVLAVAKEATTAEEILDHLPSPSAEDAQEATSLSSSDILSLIQQDSFEMNLLTSLEREPIEDGRRHPGERILADALAHSPNANLWIESAYYDTAARQPELAAGILRCVGRLPRGLVEPWGLDLAREALSHPDIEVRDAAVRAFEMWGGREALRAVSEYARGESVPWLATYAEQVIADLDTSVE